MGIIEICIVTLVLGYLFTLDLGSYSSTTKEYKSSGIKFIEYHELRHKEQDKWGFVSLYSGVVLASMLLTLLTRSWEFVVPGTIAFVSLELDAWLDTIRKVIL